jgi:formylglycine-generating enzyme required for sulfatase activity
MRKAIFAATALLVWCLSAVAAQPPPEYLWPLLKASADNSVRTFVVHWLGSSSIAPDALVAQLHRERDVSIRRALILSLGHVDRSRLDPERRRQLTSRLLEWFSSDGDPGVHGAIDWLLRHATVGPRPRRYDCAQTAALEQAERSLIAVQSKARQWYVNAEGHTLTIIGGPADVTLGAAPGELLTAPAPDAADEPVLAATIPRTFAIAAKEVTVGQFRRFLLANPDVARVHAYPNAPTRMAEVLARLSPDDAGPQIAVTWYEAAMYCNWLSRLDGLPESEWVYPAGLLQPGFELPSDYLSRTGYRLPTDTEWEFAARAGTTTVRFLGTGEQFLDEYAWYSKNPPRSRTDVADPRDPQRAYPTGQLKPNDFGLFDMYGNVWEWAQDRVVRPRPAGALFVDREDSQRRVVDDDARVRRGGSFAYEAAMARSAHRGPRTSLPSNRRDTVGFRIARTIRSVTR